MIAGLFNIPVTADAFQRFSFYNRDAHEQAIYLIQKTKGLMLPSYVLDPIPTQDFSSWLYTHQASHNSINTVLGLPGNDLTSLDPRKLDQLTNWIQLHASEHMPWGNILGYG